MSLVPTWKITKSKSSKFASGAHPPLDISLLVNLEIVSPGKHCRVHPSIPATCLGIESQTIVTFLTSAIKKKYIYIYIEN